MCTLVIIWKETSTPNIIGSGLVKTIKSLIIIDDTKR